MPISRKFLFIGVVIVTTLLVASCTESADEGQPADRSVRCLLSYPVKPPVALGPISDRLRQLNFCDERENRAAALVEGATVTTCMQEQGFEYFFTSCSERRIYECPLPEQNTIEFAERYGYGLGEYQDLRSTLSPDGATLNEEYYESLSAREQEAYDLALRGGSPVGTQVGGCLEAGDDANLAAYRRFKTIETEISELQDRIEESPELVEETALWSACMVSAGQPIESMTYYEEEYLMAYNRMTPEQYRDLQLEEIATAVADINCSETAGLAAAKRAQEEEYYATHRAQVDEWLEFLEASASVLDRR